VLGARIVPSGSDSDIKEASYYGNTVNSKQSNAEIVKIAGKILQFPRFKQKKDTEKRRDKSQHRKMRTQHNNHKGENAQIYNEAP
jgi:hypothetical protein